MRERERERERLSYERERERALPIPIFTCGCDQIRVIGQDPGHYERIDKLGISKTWVLFFENIITCQ